MSNNWQIIYVIFSTVVPVEGTNRVADITAPTWEGAEKYIMKERYCKRLMVGEREKEREEGGGEEGGKMPSSALA